MNDETADQWHLDRRVPLGLIAALLMQTGAAFWWASGMEARQAAAEAAIARQDMQLADVESDTKQIQIGAATVNAQLQSVRDSLGEVKSTQNETQDLIREIAEKLK